MLFAHKDGSLRLLSSSGNTSSIAYYYELLFTDANLSAPTMRKKTEERVILDRGVQDANGHYVQGGDDPIMEPLPFSISCKIADTTSGVSYLDEWIRSGKVNKHVLTGTKGDTYNVSGVSNPPFADSTKKCSNVECVWDGTTALGYKWAEIYFSPGEQTIAEAEDGITLNLSGQIYGTITRIATFSTSGVTDVTV